MKTIRFRVGGVFLMIAAIGAALNVRAASGTQARSQLRRTVEDSDRSAAGDVILRKSGSQQYFEVKIKNLAEDSFKIFVTTNEFTYLSTNNFLVDLVYPVALLDRTNVKKGLWQRKLIGDGEAPIEIPVFDDLADLAGRQVHIAKPGADLLTGITNLFNCVTNIVGVETNINCSTNILFGVPLIDPGQTQAVYSVLWAPIPGLLAKPAISNYNARASMTLPEIPPSPKAKGMIRTRYKASKGQSLLDVKASGLTRGQVYSLWIADATNAMVFIKAGNMDLVKDGASARFIRDTKYGDPLPQQVGYVFDLTGRPFVILDDFEDVHLEGVIP